MQLTFLGTSCMTPTKERNHSSFFLSYKGEGILFDCGEGTQRQLKIAGISAFDIKKILISHWHGDHVLGLPGLIQTLASKDYEGTLKIYGPKGTKKRFEHMFEAFVFDNQLDMEIIDINDGIFYDGKDYSIESYSLDHSVPTLGFRFVEKDRRRIKVAYIKKLGIPEGPLLGKLQQGKDITFKEKKVNAEEATYVVEGKIISYIADSTYSKNSLKIAQDADLLITDSTYTSKFEDKAEEYKHLTAKQAGLIANQANAKKLILTHFSNRYKDVNEIKEDALQVFQDVECAEDFMKIKL